MNKIVSASEFKAKCLKLIDEMQRDGVPVTITKRGKVVAELGPKGARAKELPKDPFGMLKSDKYRFDDPFSPAADPTEWEENNPDMLYRR